MISKALILLGCILLATAVHYIPWNIIRNEKKHTNEKES